MDDRVTEVKRAGKLPMLAVVTLIIIVALLGAAIWMAWSADSPSAADDAAPHPVQPVQMPSPEDGALPARPANAGPAPAQQDGEKG
jgi:flagellar basal body-associated protein FliL